MGPLAPQHGGAAYMLPPEEAPHIQYEQPRQDGSGRRTHQWCGDLHAGGHDHHWISLGGIMFSTSSGVGIPLHNRWTDYGHGYGPITVAKSGPLCLVSGLLRGNAWGHSMAQLPADCCPRGRLIFNMNNHGKTARVDVTTDGKIYWIAGGRDHSWISITGVNIHRNA